MHLSSSYFLRVCQEPLMILGLECCHNKWICLPLCRLQNSYTVYSFTDVNWKVPLCYHFSEPFFGMRWMLQYWFVNAWVQTSGRYRCKLVKLFVLQLLIIGRCLDPLSCVLWSLYLPPYTLSKFPVLSHFILIICRLCALRLRFFHEFEIVHLKLWCSLKSQNTFLTEFFFFKCTLM